MSVRETQLRPAGSPIPAPQDFGPEERATIAFFCIDGIGPVRLALLRKAFGSLAAALEADRGLVANTLDAATAASFLSVKDPRGNAERHLEQGRRCGARVVLQGSPGWPRPLRDCDFPPLLWVKGELPVEPRALAIVGSRHIDEYGRQQAAFYAEGFARAGVTIVSGGAAGADAAAHDAALRCGGKTVAVMGGGLAKLFPAENARLFAHILDSGGALVAHLPPNTAAVKQNFIVRNKVIAGLSDGVLVARAKAGSGAISTARAALALERPVLAVPGDTTSLCAEGSNELLSFDGVSPATSLSSVAQRLGWEPRARGVAKVRKPTARSEPSPELQRQLLPRAKVEIPAELRPVLDALGPDPVQFDELVGKLGLDAPTLANALMRLEILGLAREQFGRRFTRGG